MASPDTSGAVRPQGTLAFIDRLRGSVLKMVEAITENFGEEAASWLKWRICDWILALVLLFLAKRIKSARLSRVVEFMLEN